jgi:hypothetical protein
MHHFDIKGLFLYNFPVITRVFRENFLEDFQYFVAAALSFSIKR